jgi:guanosine-3',5'-bis(diphosphate) 3'-pyrophosphohydrolase
MGKNTFIDRSEFFRLYARLYSFLRQEWDVRKVSGLKGMLLQSFKKAEEQPGSETLYPLVLAMRTAVIIIDEIGLKQPAVCAVLLFHRAIVSDQSTEEIEQLFGSEVESILRGLRKVNQFSDKKNAVESENYIKLLLSIAEDIRVVFIMIAQQLQRMRDAKESEPSRRLDLAVESTYLYAPLAHRLGLYTIKSELEDLSLKYTDREQYDFIAHKLNETKRSRDRYISEFIGPVKERLDKTGLKYDIKGRTKSIHSIQNKLKKQKIEFENIYDLFAIRVILDASPEQEKAQCWQVYSIITDMYQPNPKRLKDWLSIPKSNGYESLHITVLGPDGRWVEVQIRSKRMDEIAERGLAAHWKYKGVKGETTLDNWLSSLRESLEDSDTNLSQKLTDFKLDLYDEEIFVFTPKGDLFKLPKGATVLDFAFAIHSNLGATCVSGRVNGKNVPIRHVLKSGDQVAVNTSSHQTPKQDWLNFAVTSKARTKIRQLLKEEAGKQVDIAKETLLRRMRNRKIEVDEPRLMQLIKKLRYKTVTEFYVDIASEKIDVNWVIDRYLELENKESESREGHAMVSAGEFTLKTPSPETSGSDELIIDQNLTGVDYKLAKCCNPIFGDDIFGFVSSQGIKIHRVNCPNAHDLFSRFGYRILKARWSGKTSSDRKSVV